MTTVIGVVAAAMAVWTSGAAPATAVKDEPRQRVIYSDLNLNQPADVARLYKRITHAAHLVCDLPRPWDYLETKRPARPVVVSGPLAGIKG